MDSENIVIRALASAGIDSYHEVPDTGPEAYATVQRSGGGHRDVVIDSPQVLIHCRAKTNKAAKEMASKACDAVLSIPDTVDSAFVTSVNSIYRDDDPDTGQPRWKLVVELVVND